MLYTGIEEGCKNTHLTCEAFCRILDKKPDQNKPNSAVNEDEEAIKVTPRGKHRIEISANSYF